LDLSVSPDLPAYVCYGVVLLLGLFVAIVQIRKRLGGMDGAWFVARTWLLFVAYAAVPVILFWFLDRTGAISDTSLFAAVLIGVGYERIITGGSQVVQAPGEISSFWTPFVAYADKVSKVILDRGARNQRRLADKIIAEVMRRPDAYGALEALALARSADVEGVRKKLEELDATPKIGDADRLEKKTSYLYGLLLSVPDIHYLLKEKQIVSDILYWGEIKRVPQWIGLLALVLGIVGGLYILSNMIYPDYQQVRNSYYVWRLGKANSTSVDQFRSRHALIVTMHGQQSLAATSSDELIYLVQRPGLSMERVDFILETLLESRQESGNELPRKLVQALRAASVDARSRIHGVLTFFSSPCAKKVDESLVAWKPMERDSPTTLEDKIARWDRYWTAECPLK
jgi:hypothetical protein